MKRLRLIENKQERFLSSLDGLELTLGLPDGTKKKVSGRFDCCRIPMADIPDDYHHYAIRHGDDGSVPMSLEKTVWVNHYGDFLCREDLSSLIDSTLMKAVSIVEWNFSML